MFGLITRRAHEQALTAAQAKSTRLAQELDATKKELAGARALLAKPAAPADPFQQVIAATRARLTDEQDLARPIDGGSPAPLPLTSQLRRAKGHAAALAEQLATVTAANQHCTCGGHP